MRKNPLTETVTRVTPSPYSREPWEIVQCEETGMVYLANPPDYSRMSEEFAWEKTYAEERERRRKKEPVFSALSTLVKRFRKAIRPRERIETLSAALLRQAVPAAEGQPLILVDVGCGIGDKAVVIAENLKNAPRVPVRPIGIEISRAQAEEADRQLRAWGGHCIEASALEGMRAIDDQSADLIILCSFLEHEVHPLPLLRACADKLVDAGRVVIKVPNFNSVNRRIRQERWCGFRFPDHVNYFTPDTLTQIIERSGLQLVRMNFFDRLPTSDNLWAIAGKKQP